MENIIVPSFGDSIINATVAAWLKEDGETVKPGDALITLETDKVSADVEATEAGILHHSVEEGDTVDIGAKLGYIVKSADGEATVIVEPTKPVVKEEKIIVEVQEEIPVKNEETVIELSCHEEEDKPARFIRKPMSRLRRTIAKRLVEAQHDAAILTTFNECDMSAIKEIRKQYNENFYQEKGIKLGFMSFFMKAVVKALKEHPSLNSKIDGDDLIENLYYDLSIAIGSDKGLITPVIRDADAKSLLELEAELAALSAKARSGKVTMEDLTGGCFTISNGGTYGSLLSTPILNPPQSGILGMHTIQDRPVVRDGQIVIRPMMYLALSYDHRIVDGKQAVEFLICIKNALENPIFEL